MPETRADWIHFGCGACAPIEWTNFDGSPSLRLQRLPIVGRLVPGGPFGRFPENVLYGDIVKGLPVRMHSAALLYSSHVLEHLSLEDLRAALRNCRQLLRADGIFRLVLPDLEVLVNEYVADASPDAAIRFVDHTLLGRRNRPRGFMARIRDCLGNANHLWMWDYKSLSKELADVGFSKIRRVRYQDSQVDAFRLVEKENRWERAIGIECRAAG